MRKNITLKALALSSLLILTMLATVGCTTKKEEPKPSDLENVESDVEIEHESSDEQFIAKPIDIDIDLGNIEDRMFNVSFESGGIYTNDDGDMTAIFTVYDYEQFDMVTMSRLSVGDLIYVRGEEVLVDSIEVDDFGIINLNGGLENNGYWFKTDDSGVYYEIVENDHKFFNEIGQIEVPVSGDMVFIDNSDLDNPEAEYVASDFLQEELPFYFHFVPENTTIRIADGQLVEINRVFMP